MLLDYYLYYFYYTYLGFPFIIRVAVVFISIFLPLIILTTISLIFFVRRYIKRKKLWDKLENDYAAKIRDILVSKEVFLTSKINEILQIQKKKLTNSHKEYFTECILNIAEKEDFVNNDNQNLLIDYFILQPFWENRVRYGGAGRRQKALRKLSDLNIKISNSLISSLSYNKNPYIRKRARYHHMYNSEHAPFKFLEEDFDVTFNEWDKIEVHRMLAKRIEKGLPFLNQWLINSKNPEFQSFLIDEIRIFQQKNSGPYLVELIESSSLKVRKNAIITLGEIKYQEAEPLLISIYSSQPSPIQKAIIRTIEKLQSGEALEFLEETYRNTSDRETEIVILKAIYNYGNAGKHLFFIMKEDKKEEQEEFSKLIFEHVSNPLIKY